jgi:hypothetical protein
MLLTSNNRADCFLDSGVLFGFPNRGTLGLLFPAVNFDVLGSAFWRLVRKSEHASMAEADSGLSDLGVAIPLQTRLLPG